MIRLELRKILDLADLPDEAEEKFLGATGTIVKIVPKFQYPYGVKFDNKTIQDEDCVYWDTEEIEFIEEELFKKEKFLHLLDKFITRSNSWIEDAEKREDYNDVFYYQGQRDVVKELKDMVEK